MVSTLSSLVSLNSSPIRVPRRASLLPSSAVSLSSSLVRPSSLVPPSQPLPLPFLDGAALTNTTTSVLCGALSLLHRRTALSLLCVDLRNSHPPSSLSHEEIVSTKGEAMDLFLKGMNGDGSECPFDLRDIQRCPFFRNINEPTNFSFSSTKISIPASYAPISYSGQYAIRFYFFSFKI